MVLRRKLCFLIAASCANVPVGLLATDNAQVTQALTYKPQQSDVEYDQVKESDVEKCEGKIEKRAGITGLLIRDSAGQPIRWFADGNGDKRVDQWSYFLNGAEVYREIDSDHNEKADQYRWFGTAGMRWGIDSNEDGKIDQWKIISAEELTSEVVEAIRNRDTDRFKRLILTADELSVLGLGEEKKTQLAERIRNAANDFQEFIQTQKVVTKDTQWEHFGAERPGVLPAGTDGSSSDLTFYENVVAVIGDGAKDSQLIIGNLVNFNGSWKLVDSPKAASNGVVEGGLFTASLHRPREMGSGSGLDATMQKLLDELQAIDSKLPTASEKDKAVLHGQRADLLEKLIAESDTDDDVRTWVYQFADTISAAVQSGEFPAGLDKLKSVINALQQTPKTKPHVGYVVYRGIGSQYFEDINKPNANYQTIEEQYLKSLEDFVTAYPDTEDAADAMMRIGLSREMAGDAKAAEEWYKKTATKFPASLLGKKANGAVTRLNLTGRTLSFKGKTIDGKAFDSQSPEYTKRPVVIQFWASWCEPCKADMRELRQLQIDFSKEKLAVVGVNLDKDLATAQKFLAAEKSIAPWTHIYEEGGMDSNLAVKLGVLSLPVTIVLDSEGKVIHSASHFNPEVASIIRESMSKTTKK